MRPTARPPRARRRRQGWPANQTVTAGALTDTGYTLTFSGGVDVSPLAITNANGASGSVTETAKGAAGLLPPRTLATAGTVTDTGYTLTFAGASARTDLLPLTVTNGTGGAAGTVRETVKGTPGVAGWLSDTTVTIGTVADTGYNVTFNALTPLGSARQTGLGDVEQLVRHGRDRRHGDDHDAGQVRDRPGSLPQQR